MNEKLPLKALHELLLPHYKHIGRTINHVKSNTIYIIKDVYFKEADMTIEFNYYPLLGTYPVKFSRPIAELYDGRFQFLL